MSSANEPEVPPEIPPPWRPGQPPDEPIAPTPPPVPTVPIPSGPSGGPDDAFARLLRRRIVLVTGELAHEVATRAAAQLMTLNAEGDDPVALHLNCPDGDIDAAMSLVDTIELMTVEVTAVCQGSLGGPAIGVYVAAGRRTCSAHATFRLSEPLVSVSGRTDEIDAHATALRRQLDRLVASVAEATGQTVDRVAADMGAGRVLDAEDAVAYGLVDEISRSAPRPAPDTDRSQR